MEAAASGTRDPRNAAAESIQKPLLRSRRPNRIPAVHAPNAWLDGRNHGKPSVSSVFTRTASTRTMGCDRHEQGASRS